ncbi:unnamed protein product [Camellia sinensis]
MEDLGSVVSDEERNAIDDAIRHVVQEVKLLAKKEDREGLDSSINELLLLGMQRLISCFFVDLFSLNKRFSLLITLFLASL